MCHEEEVGFFGELLQHEEFRKGIDGLRFGAKKARKKVAVLPDIYGLTDFYKGFASYLADFGAEVYLANPWSSFGEPEEMTREEAYRRRDKLRDKEYCDRLGAFLDSKDINAIIGFCIGGNFSLELARRGYAGTNVAVYPLPWGMENQDAITPAFEYMPSLSSEITIFMGGVDHLAGPDNIQKIEEIADENENLTLHLYRESDHGFIKDIDGSDEKLAINARDALEKMIHLLFSG